MNSKAGQPQSHGQALPVPVAAAPQPSLSQTGAPPPWQILQPSQPGSVNENGGILYDYLSSFDPLQAHAFQLTASAGLTNILAPAPTGMQPTSGIPYDGTSQPPPTVFNLHSTGHAPQTNGTAPQPYFYIQPTAAPAGLHAIAPAASPGVAPGYLLPAAPGYSQQIRPGGFPAVAAVVGPPPPGQPHMPPQLQGAVVGGVQHPPPLAPAMPSSEKRELADINPADRHPSKRPRELAPSVVSSSTHLSNKNNANSQLDVKPPVEATQAELDRMSPAERRRYERNLREQQRSYKISQQIKELRDVLAESNVPFKPNKYSILLSVVDYIKQLQARAIMLDAEHQKLITTIRQTNEMVNTGTTPSSVDEDTIDGNSDNEMLFVQGLDYKSVFEQCPAALGIASLDGRIMECNPEFQQLIGFEKNDLLKQSLFNLVKNHQDIFRAMAEMLKVAEIPGQDPASLLKHRFWSGEVVSNINLKVRCLDNGEMRRTGAKTYQYLTCRILFYLTAAYESYINPFGDWNPKILQLRTHNRLMARTLSTANNVHRHQISWKGNASSRCIPL